MYCFLICLLVFELSKMPNNKLYLYILLYIYVFCNEYINIDKKYLNIKIMSGRSSLIIVSMVIALEIILGVIITKNV